MLNKELLQHFLSQTEVARRDAVLLILSFEVESPKSISDIRDIGISSGLREIQKWNIADVLSKAKGLTLKLPGGWILTKKGKEYITTTIGIEDKRAAIVNVANDLRKLSSSLNDENTQAFLNEAISCFEIGNYRAAVVLSWVGAVWTLYKYVVDNTLDAFNTEAGRRDTKWKIAKTTDDLARLKEKDFLDILSSISILGKNVKQELENCLTLRNGCGHPNTLTIGENRVASHIEILILNVFNKFRIQ